MLHLPDYTSMPAELTVDNHITEVWVYFPKKLDYSMPDNLRVFYKEQEITKIIPLSTLEVYCIDIDRYKEVYPDGCDLAHRQKELEMESA
jgi:hypothetical protein